MTTWKKTKFPGVRYKEPGTRRFKGKPEKYFSIRYKKYIDPSQEQHFRLWHQEDPPEKEELIRNDLIENIQKNRNPFVDIPELVELIEDF